MFIEILFKMVPFKGGVLIYAEHCNMVKVWLIYVNVFLKVGRGVVESRELVVLRQTQ